MPILRDLLKADDPATQAAVVFEFAQRGLRSKPVSDDDVRAMLALSSSKSADVRREVGHAMWKFLPRSEDVKQAMRERLIELARDEDKAVRDTSTYSLARLYRE